MVRRRLAVKRLDPWSVLKFGAVANVALLGIFLLVAGVVWFIIDRLQLVDQVCGMAADVGFTRCEIHAGNVFRALGLLGLLWVVIQTAVLVFLAFLHNLIADLTGGLVLGVVDDTSEVQEAPARQITTAAGPPPHRDPFDGGYPPPGDTARRANGPEVTRPQAPVGGSSPSRTGPGRRGGGEELFGPR